MSANFPASSSAMFSARLWFNRGRFLVHLTRRFVNDGLSRLYAVVTAVVFRYIFLHVTGSLRAVLDWLEGVQSARLSQLCRGLARRER